MDSSDDPPPGPSTEEVQIDDGLLTALAQAHDPNPVVRRTDPFLNDLEYSSSCSLTELKFMICHSKECPTISRKS